MWKNPEMIDEPIHDWGNYQYEGLKMKGLTILDEYHAKQRFETREVIATEHSFCVPLGDHFVTGIVDLLEIKKSSTGKPTLRIVDYKTASRKPTLQGLKFDLQFTAYHYASTQKEFWLGNPEQAPEHDVDRYAPMPDGEKLWEEYKDVPRRCIWYHLWGNAGNVELYAGDRKQEDYDRMSLLIESIAYAKEKEVFIPTISVDSCKFCDFKEICPSMAPVLSRENTSFLEDEEDTGIF